MTGVAKYLGSGLTKGIGPVMARGSSRVLPIGGGVFGDRGDTITSTLWNSESNLPVISFLKVLAFR